MLKIGIVCYPTYGGSGVLATELGKALAKEGHHVHFITYKEPARLDAFNPRIFYHEVSFENYSLFEYPPYETALASKMVDIAQFENLDILHVHYAIPHASAAFIAKQILKEKGIDIKVITTLHGTDITLVGKDASFRPVVTFSINQSDIVTTVSHSLKEDTYLYFDIKKDIKVIHNFVDKNRFYKHFNQELRDSIAKRDEKILIHTSNFRKVKRIPDIIYAFKKLKDKIPCKLLLVGDGPERINIEELCRELEVCDDVKFYGKLDNVEVLLSIADLFLMPSETESFGLAALEAMACEVPVVSSNAGGLPEINIEEVTGILCEVGNIDAYVTACYTILHDDNTLARYKKNALEQAEKFDLIRILPQYIELYKNVLEQK